MVLWFSLLSGRTARKREPSSDGMCTCRAGWSNYFQNKKFTIFCTTKKRRKDEGFNHEWAQIKNRFGNQFLSESAVFDI